MEGDGDGLSAAARTVLQHLRTMAASTKGWGKGSDLDLKAMDTKIKKLQIYPSTKIKK